MESLNPSAGPITPPSYDHIKLTKEQEAEALRKAREDEHFRLEKEKYYEMIKTRINWKIPTARELYEALRETKSQTGERFQITKHNASVIHSLCLYFAGDERFCDQQEGFSLDKGILLLGKPGVGKTHLMDFFKKNPHASYSVPTCKSIAEKYVKGWKRDELTTIEYYSTLQPTESSHVYNQEYLGICFGDMGSESDSSNYGNKRSVIEEIIFNRYESKLPFKYTHMTSNLDAKMITDKYGERMRDRLREMCNQLVLEGDSFRK